MQVTVEETGAIERKLKVSVPSDEVGAEVSKRLRNVSRQARIPGFRPGKAPMSVIQKRFSGQVTNEVISDKIQSTYQEALTESQIPAAGLVSIEPTPWESGKDLEYVATLDVFPEIPSPTLDGKEIEKPVCEVADEDVDRTIEDLRKRNAEFSEKDGAADSGDRVTIDFEGKIDGEPFAGGSAEDFSFVIGDGQMLEDFDKGVSGAAAGESRNIDFTFPEDYNNADVAGKAVAFEIRIKLVERADLPEVDDAFAGELGISEGGVDKMRQEIRASLERELASKLRSTLRERVMEALLEANSIEVPRPLVEEEIDRAVDMITRQLSAQGIPADGIDRSNYAEEARKRVALGLIAREVIEKNELKADGDRVRGRIEEMAQGYDDAEAFVNHYYSDQGRLQQIEAMVLEEQVVDSMLETANVKETSVSFRDFMNPGSA